MPKVCLIIPPSSFLLDERVFPFLGVLKVAASLESVGWPVEVLDLSGFSNYLDVLVVHLGGTDATHFGVTATTPQFPAAADIARTIRQVQPGARVIIGGTHATLVVAALHNEQARGVSGRALRAFQQLDGLFDVIVAGDGEETIFLACQDGAPKVIDADGRKSPLGQHFLDNERLTATAFPARHLLAMDTYNYTIAGVRATSLIAQLGCPYQCGFCAGRSSPMLRHIRTRTTENIVAEMVHIHETYGHHGFMFYDDELNVSKSMVELMLAIEEKQRELGVTWQLRGFIKSELFTKKQGEAMRRAGFRQILVGFESGSPRILTNIRKMATREDNTRCVEVARECDLSVKALMSIGHPGESPDTVRETREWLVQVRPADFDVTIITPYPGSPYYDEAILGEDGVWTYTCQSGDQLHQREVDYTREADYYKGIPGGGYVSHVFTDFLSPEALVCARDDMEHTVRKELGIPFNPSRAAELYEHSMGQGPLPPNILRVSGPVVSGS